MQISVAPRSTASCTLASTCSVLSVRASSILAMAREGAELAADEADVGEVDVAIHHVGDHRSDIGFADVVGGADQRREVGALGLQQRQAVVEGQLVAGDGALEHWQRSAVVRRR